MTNATVHDAAREISVWADGLFRGLEDLERKLSAHLTADFAGEPPFEVGRKARAALGVDVAEFLGAHSGFDGAGLIFKLDLLEPSTARIEWWITDGDDISRRDFILDRSSDRFYDYEYLEWFEGGFNAGTRTLAGPYIDHLGVDDYIVTLTVPCHVGDRRVGVAGIDILMNDVESQLIRMLAPLGHGAALLSRHNQVLVGNSGELSTGVRIAVMPPGYSRLPLDVAGVDLSLLYRDDES